MARLVAVVVAVAALLVPGPGAAREVHVSEPGGDAVVVAVIDGRINPYHWDFAAAHMPQALDGDPANDLPLAAPPHTWLRGFPDPTAFTGYAPLSLGASSDPTAEVDDLRRADNDAWARLEPSSRKRSYYYWVPGTKAVGLLDFAVNRVYGSNSAHGSKVASVSVGNLHGTCPQCLLVFLSFDDEESAETALTWALSQPWIDAVVNSYGFNTTTRYRDRLYSGSDVEAQREASERGQTIFFSAGNGLENDFVLPNTTYFSSQEGPDWTITVGAVSLSGHEYTGAGKPADVAAPGESYPSIGGTTVTGTSTFGGTSNATPVVAGVYADALTWARARLPGPSRVQEQGAIAQGGPVSCRTARGACELGDGTLTARELRTRVLHGAVHTPQGLQLGSSDTRVPITPAEATFLAEGHGTYFARAAGPEGWQAERQRVTGPLDGSRATTPRPDGEAEWFVVDSFCRQEIWLPWRDGDWRAGDPLPLPTPLWPLRTALAAACPALFPPTASASS